MSAGKRKKGSLVCGASVSGCESGSGDAGSGGEACEVGGEAGGVGRLVDCSQADDRRMIRLVRERPLLYARNNMPVASYYSQVKKLWQQVADTMGWSGTHSTRLTRQQRIAAAAPAVAAGKRSNDAILNN